MALLLDELKQRKIYNLEQPRFAGMPVYPNHRPFMITSLGVDTSKATSPTPKVPVPPVKASSS
jgi:hypothetical protein